MYDIARNTLVESVGLGGQLAISVSINRQSDERERSEDKTFEWRKTSNYEN